MEKEFENYNQEQSTDQSSEKHEGHQTQPSSYQRQFRPDGRPQRPRIQNQHNYVREEGFRPEGFGAGLQGRQQDGQQGYHPRYNQQGSYQPRQQQGYRPRYNNEQGGYQPRQQQGYRPRYNNNEGEGFQPHQYDRQGFQPRQGYQPHQQQGYRPRYNNNGEEGYQPRQGYGRQGYQQRQGYQPRQQGGFRQPRQNFNQNPKFNFKRRIDYNEDYIDPTVPIRLNKFLANAGVCSRREADEFIQAGVVTVNGEVVKELGTKVLRTDDIRFQDKPVIIEKKVYVLLNKPKDCVTTSDDPQQRKTVMDLVKGICPERIYPVGRLDRNTTGVLLLTNDGDLASKLTHPKFLKKKVYHVFLDKNITAYDMQRIAEGIELEDGEVHADAIDYPDENDKSQVGIEIHSGKNRIVRRIFEHLGYRVVKLDRVQFAGLTKKNLRRGDWRFLTEKEVEMLRMGAFE